MTEQIKKEGYIANNPQFEAARAIYMFLDGHGSPYRFKCSGLYGDTGQSGFGIVTGPWECKVYFDVGIIGDIIKLTQHDRGSSGNRQNGQMMHIHFDLCDPSCFDDLVIAIEGGFKSWDQSGVTFTSPWVRGIS